MTGCLKFVTNSVLSRLLDASSCRAEFSDCSDGDSNRKSTAPAVIVSRACVSRASPRGLAYLLRHLVKGFVVLSKVFVVRLLRVVSPHYWRGGSRWNLPSSRT